jgi:hypothetical protein
VYMVDHRQQAGQLSSECGASLISIDTAMKAIAPFVKGAAAETIRCELEAVADDRAILVAAAEAAAESVDRANASMRLDTKPGERVVFMFPDRGDSVDVLDGKRHLVVGEAYTVAALDVRNFVTYVILRECPQVFFNSVQFVNVNAVNAEAQAGGES